jgi:hypothetical protein
MTQESEVEKKARPNNYLLKGIFVLLLVLVLIVGGYFAVGLYWAEHQKQLVEQQAQNIGDILNGIIPTTTPTPSIFRIYLNTEWAGQRLPEINVGLMTDSQNTITFSDNDILYNGRSAGSYGSFAPQLSAGHASDNSGSYHRISGQMSWNNYHVNFPIGVGSPWSSGVSVQMTITTNNAKGSTTFTLP